MKVHKLEIKYIRGIPELKIEPKGKSLVIYGANGSGKSAIIDALDFLLTGKIARLSGEGTEGVSLKEHGPHIDKVTDLKNVEVNAEIDVPEISETVCISRKMSKPGELIYDSKYDVQLAPIIELLNRGQYVLTRKEVLKLITSKSSTRAQQIQKILKLGEIEEIRLSLVQVWNKTKNQYNSAQLALDKAKRDVISISGHQEYQTEELLMFVNEQRKNLGGTKIIELLSEKLQEGLIGVRANTTSVNHNSLTKRIANLKTKEINIVTEEVSDADNKLRTAIKGIRSDPHANWNAERYTFTKNGIKLIRDEGECPLCDKEWPKGELVDYLQQRIDSQSVTHKTLTDCCDTITTKANDIKFKIQQITDIVQSVVETKEAKKSEKFVNGLQHLNYWSNNLNTLANALTDPIKEYKDD